MFKLSNLRPQETVHRYEREAPGELLHIDIKKLGRFEDVGHRITGDYRRRTRHVGWEYVFVAVDDHSRVAFTNILAGVDYLGRRVASPRNVTGTRMSLRSFSIGSVPTFSAESRVS